ncbi:hypothetical protein [Ferrimonas pelagia]|uniref:Uncharacterized protein n=1 Tax=Ferrimonas pelagia TaxID=1177826 RepID=A0ABP9E957_9GAMM
MDIAHAPIPHRLTKAIRTALWLSAGMMLTACGSSDDNDKIDLCPEGDCEAVVPLPPVDCDETAYDCETGKPLPPECDGDDCEDGEPGPGPGPTPPPGEAGIGLSDWAFETGQSDWVAAAQVAGSYAAADGQALAIEIRDINESLTATIDAAEILALVPEANVSDGEGICAMTFTPSGRFLYFSVCAGDDDAILAYNTNTDTLSLFDRRPLSAEPGARLGMSYFQGELFVGSDAGIVRYPATRNAVYEQAGLGQGELIGSDSPVRGLAVDMVTKTLYASTDLGLFRMATDGNALQSVASLQGLGSLSMGRIYGAEHSGGLFMLQHSGDDKQILRVGLDELRSGGAVSPKRYTAQLDAAVSDIAATADGRMMLAQADVQMMYEKTDTRLSYDAWLHDELDGYKQAIFSLVEGDGIAGTSDLIGKPGMLMRKLEKAGDNPNKTPIADNVGWALFLLMAIDQVAPDPDIERVVELLIRTHAGLTPGHGGERTVDGHFVRVYANDGKPNASNPQPQVYVSMKYLPAAYKAAELYPDNENLQQYKEYLRQLFKRAMDTVQAEQRITWTNDDFGPVPTGGNAANLMANETWIYGDIGAAQDPYVTSDYATYTYDRDSFKVDNYIKGEPVIMASHAAFIVMGATLILNHHFYGDGWVDQNHNYYGLTMAETDDMGAPYFAAFSAGNHPACPSPNPDGMPCGGYYNDGPSDHPNDILHFPAVLGFGQHQYTAPMVGGYMAYRDGRRQPMNNASGGESIEMLTRWSMMHDDFVMSSVGIADFWYGGIGLVETILPGTIDKLRGDFFRPYVEEQDGQLVYSNMTPRQVVGIDADGLRTEYGFQMSPYTLPRTHAEYEVLDPLGDWIELDDLVNKLDGKTPRFSNPSFANGTAGWTVQGSAAVIDGTGSHAVQLFGGSAISQPLDVALALDGSRYIVHALVGAKQGEGQLRLRWRADPALNSPVLAETFSEPVQGDSVMMALKTAKPAGANYLHIEFVANSGSVTFESTAVTLRGAAQPIENGDFAQGLDGWQASSSGIVLVTDPDLAVSGDKVIRFVRNATATSAATLQRSFDVSNDPVGTRYLFRFHADATEPDAKDFKFAVNLEAKDANDERTVLRNDVGDVLPGHYGERTFTYRKRPGDHAVDISMEMKRSGSDISGMARVYIDDFRLDKERLFKDDECVADSPTGCLPSLHQ